MLDSPGARVVVAGSGTYAAGSRLPAVGSVADTVADLGRCLVERAGLAPAGLTTLIDPADPVELGAALVEAAGQASDALVFHYVGHGLVGADGELYLATYATVDPGEGIIQHQALPYAAVRQALARCAAPHVVVVLDCCFSGRATPGGRDPGRQVLDATPQGTYLLTAAGRDQAAWAPAGERHTAFTGALLELLTVGDPAAPGLLTLDDVYRCLSRTLPARGFAPPRRQATDQGDRQPLAPNPARGGGARPGFSPYQGLAAFGPDDADYFFGRTELTRVLVDRVAQQVATGELLVVTGPSGSGKSSLLRAGLVSSLRCSPGTEIAVLTPGSDPVGTLAARFADLDGTHPADLRARLAGDPGALAVLFEQALGDRQAVVIVDQFEEVFTACADEEPRRVFIQALHELAGRAAVVIGVRADFFGHCAAHGQLVPALGRAVVVGPMTPAQLRQSIEGPARQAGLTLQPGLIELILEDLGHDPGDTEPRPGGAAMLPLLSHALLVTWQHREGSVLTMAGYRATGGIRQAIARTADATHDHLDLHGRQSARLLLTRLVRLGEGQDDTRRVLPLSDLLPAADSPQHATTREVLDRFVRARLLTVHADTAQIAHEALIRAWPQLRLWIETDRTTLLIHQQLGEDAADWTRHGRDPAFLYRGTRLSAAHEAATLWRTDPGRYPALTDHTREFLRAGQGAATRRALRWRLSLITLVVLLIMSAAGFGATTYMAADAAQERARALSRQLAAQSENIGDTDIDLSRRLSTAAWHVAPTDEARLSLLKQLHDPERAILRQGVAFVRFDKAGSRLVTSNGDGVLRFWDGHTGGAIPVFTGLAAEASRMEINEDASRVLTVSQTGVARLWNAVTGAPIGAPVEGAAGTPYPGFSPDGSLLAVSGGADAVRVVDTATGKVSVTLSGLEDGTVLVAFSRDGSRVVTSSARAAQLWDLATGEPIATVSRGRSWQAHFDQFNADGSRWAMLAGDGLSLRDGVTGREIETLTPSGEFGFSPDGSRLLVLGKTAQLRDAATGDLIAQLGKTGYTVFSPDGSRMATAGPGVLKVWETSSGKLLAALQGHTGQIDDMKFSPDGSRLASAGSDRTVRLWDVRDGEAVATMAEQAGQLRQVVFSPDGALLASTYDDSDVRLSDAKTGEVITFLAGHEGAVYDLTFSPDSTRLVTTAADGTARMWDTTTTRATTYQGHEALVHGVAVSPDGARLATVGWDGTAKLWSGGGPPVTHEHGKGRLYAVAYDHDGSRVAVSGHSGVVEILDARTGRTVTELAGHSGPVKAAAFRPDGSRVATVGDDGDVRLWKSAGGASIAVVPGGNGPVLSAAYHPDGSRLATGDYNGGVSLRDGGTGRPVLSLRGHMGAVYAVAFSPDGSRLASGGHDGIIRLWDPATGKLVVTLKGHTGPVYGLDFSPDGARLASAGKDGTVKLWDLVTSKPITALLGHGAPVYSVAFTSDSSRLLSGGKDGTARLWRLRRPADPFSAVCEQLGEPMTQQEWTQYLRDEPFEQVCPDPR
ncbi:caspase, EACC1-associated type [Nonomuraea sp. PA05]|uniref:caspase, EACC1-associated type n=1 Tax=Nonomuraea sp. PA05 TaxID=2604466 RepID=UPI001651CC91|nr:caspase family protein [Nonomuraea sp. PA05]